MDVRQLAFIQAEFARSRQEKRSWYHAIWDQILSEYGMSSFSDLLESVREHRVVTAETVRGVQGRVATLNVLCRKMQALMGFQNPEFLVENTNPLDEPIAAIVEAALKQVVISCDWAGENDPIKMDAVLYGTAIAKVGFGSEFVYDEQAWSAPVPQAAKKLLGDDKDQPYGLTTEYTNFNVKEGFPMMKHVPVRDIFYNPGVRKDSDIRRTYHVNRRPIVDVLHDSRYDNTAKRQITVMRAGLNEDRYFPVEPFASEMEYTECIELFDHASRQFCVFTEHATRPLIDWTPFPYPIASPYHKFSPIPMDGTVWGMPYALLLLGQAQAINRCRMAVNEAVQRDAKTIFLYNADKWSSDETQRAQQARSGEWVPKENLDPQDPGFMAYTFSTTNPEVMQLANIHQQDQNFVSGLTDQTRGVRGTGETATEVQVRQEQQNVTVDDFAMRYERFQVGLGKSTVLLMLSRWNPDRLVKVVGPNENIFFWTPLNVERVQGSFTLAIIAGSGQKRDKAVQRQQWTELLPQLGPMEDRIMAAMQQGVQGPIDWNEVLRESLDQYDPVLARRILRPQNTAELLLRLMEQHSVMPRGVSPELAAQVKAVADKRLAGALPPGGQEGLQSGVQSLESGGIAPPAPPQAGGSPVPGGMPGTGAPPTPSGSTVNPQGGQVYAATPGMAGRLN